jgi:hypothetical protein
MVWLTERQGVPGLTWHPVKFYGGPVPQLLVSTERGWGVTFGMLVDGTYGFSVGPAFWFEVEQ